MKTIVELAEKYNTDKKMNNGKPSINGLPGHNYADIYDKYLTGFKVDKMLEIGIARGASIRMWSEYFEHKVEIHGIDIDKCDELRTPKIIYHQGDQKDIEFLNRKLHGLTFDLIIDDGSHRMRDQQISLKTLFPKLRSGGLYVIEDLHTSFIPEFYSTFPETTTFILLKMLELRYTYKNHYLSAEEYYFLYSQIKNIEIIKIGKYIIGFIRKK
jgi:cephalosporin hydroxylase